MGLAERILVVGLKRFSYPGYSTLSHFKLNDNKIAGKAEHCYGPGRRSPGFASDHT